jgi:hypothetical protein
MPVPGSGHTRRFSSGMVASVGNIAHLLQEWKNTHGCAVCVSGTYGTTTMALRRIPIARAATQYTRLFRTVPMAVLVATDCFTAAVWTLGGLVTSYVLFCMHLGSRQGHVAGVTSHPNEAWMVQVARNVTMEAWGCLSPGPYLIHDRDTQFCPAFQQRIEDARIT